MKIPVIYKLQEQYVNVVIDGECNHAEAEQDLVDFAYREDVLTKNAMVCRCGHIEEMEYEELEGDEY
jgi:hypothetical protein